MLLRLSRERCPSRLRIAERSHVDTADNEDSTDDQVRADRFVEEPDRIRDGKDRDQDQHVRRPCGSPSPDHLHGEDEHDHGTDDDQMGKREPGCGGSGKCLSLPGEERQADQDHSRRRHTHRIDRYRVNVAK